MNDTELINKIAEIWVSNGGDSEGVDWSISKIKERVEELTQLQANDE